VPFKGYPLIWMEAGKLLQTAQPRDKVRRQVVSLSGKESDRVKVELAVPQPEGPKGNGDTPRVTETTHRIEGRFRGQQIVLNTPIKLHAAPQLTQVAHPLPPMADVAVRAPKEVHGQYGEGNGSVAIVLDCSGSMRPPRGEQFGPTTKFVEATRALRQVLRTVPRGTMVSVWAFGQAVPPNNTVKVPEQSIKRVIEPTKWDPADPGRLDEVMKKIEYPTLVPWNESPIVRTMLHAAREDLAQAAGFKTLIVITDGMDNRIESDNEFNPDHKPISTLLVENFQDIELYVIGFRVASAEQAKAREQFSVIEEPPLRGKYIEIENAGDLVLALRRAAEQKLRYWIDSIDGRPTVGKSKQGLDVGQGPVDQWLPRGLAPGSYQVRTYTSHRISRNVALHPSDLLLLELVPVRKAGGPEDELTFRRALYSKTHFPLKPKESAGNWLAALLQNQRRPDGSAQMLLALEHHDIPDTALLYQIKPSAVWLEVDTSTGDRDTFSQRWYYQPGYPAPTYGIDVPHWPARQLPGGAASTTGAPARPVLRAWWSPEFKEPRGVSLEKGHEYAALEDLSNRRVALNGSQVIVESVTVEEHVVENEASRQNRPPLRRKDSCLVVRLSYPKDSPVWVKLHGLRVGGHEHRYFTQANKCTAIFWPVSREEASEVLRGIEIVSVSAFKAKAQANNYYVEMNKLPEPRPGDNRPLPGVDLDALSARPLGADSGDWRTAEEKGPKEIFVGLPGPDAPGIVAHQPVPGTTTHEVWRKSVPETVIPPALHPNPVSPATPRLGPTPHVPEPALPILEPELRLPDPEAVGHRPGLRPSKPIPAWQPLPGP
jgi:hypothetical protein